MASQSDNKPWSRYRNRIDNVIEFIHGHLAEPLSSDTLAEVANLSPYHWHRIYRAITGESAAATVKRSRMHRAAADLIRTDKPIADIGSGVGYPEVHSFTRTFKSYYGVTPGAFRTTQASSTNTPDQQPQFDNHQYPVVVEDKPDMYLVGLWHQGDFMTIGATFEKAMAQCAVNGLLPQYPVTAGVYMADPDIKAMEDLQSFAGVQVDAGTPTPAGLELLVQAGGRYAVMTHQGPYLSLIHI